MTQASDPAILRTSQQYWTGKKIIIHNRYDLEFTLFLLQLYLQLLNLTRIISDVTIME
jgi:hypothetical protein